MSYQIFLCNKYFSYDPMLSTGTGAVEEAHAQHVINAEHLDLTATNIVQTTEYICIMHGIPKC